jgi:hypothetical protein
MTTLKQIYNDICKSHYECPPELTCLDCGIMAFKKWLQQKPTYRRSTPKWTGPPEVEFYLKSELLEELEQ